MDSVTRGVREFRRIIPSLSCTSPMRLLTHNMLTCSIKGVKNGFPLKIEATQIETVAADFNAGTYVRARLRNAAAACIPQSAATRPAHSSSLSLALSPRLTLFRVLYGTDFLRNLLPKIEWRALYEASLAVRNRVAAPRVQCPAASRHLRSCPALPSLSVLSYILAGLKAQPLGA